MKNVLNMQYLIFGVKKIKKGSESQDIFLYVYPKHVSFLDSFFLYVIPFGQKSTFPYIPFTNGQHPLHIKDRGYFQRLEIWSNINTDR